MWVIFSFWLSMPDSFVIAGEFPTQAKCIAGLREYVMSREQVADIKQCVLVRKESLHEYYGDK